MKNATITVNDYQDKCPGDGQLVILIWRGKARHIATFRRYSEEFGHYSERVEDPHFEDRDGNIIDIGLEDVMWTPAIFKTL